MIVDSKSNYFNEKQHEWLKKRLGRITSSMCHLLFVGGKRPMTETELSLEKAVKGRRTTVDTLLGEGAITYLQGLVDEMTTGEPSEEMDFKQTEWGKANELDAILTFETISGLHVDYQGISNPEFVEYGDFAGGSPDGDVLEPQEDAICECKCHYDGAIHTKKLLISSVEDFKNKFWKEYCQDQMNMIVKGKTACYSISYDPRKKNPALRTKVIRIPLDLEWKKELETRLEAAINMMADILDQLDKNLFVK